MLAEINAEMLIQTVQSVFTNMMNLNVSPCEIPWVAAEDRLMSSVHLSGDWNGALLFECNREQACLFASHFLSIDPPECVDDDVRDVLSELANMIGGNIKSAMAMGLSLSLPSVVDGSNCGRWVSGSEVPNRFAFECNAGHFWVTLLTPVSKRFMGST